MITISALFFVVTVHLAECYEKYLEVPNECGGQTNMDSFRRRVAVQEHNWKRFYLATGIPFKDNRPLKFPTASDMNALYYDCDLENEAYEIARGCHNGDPDFDYVGSNNETIHDYFFQYSFIGDAVNSWWNTALEGGTLVDLTPSDENRPMIPFLQMANGGINKVGCAYHRCGDYYDGDTEPFLLFVCKYGDSQIKLRSPLYTEGPPCDSCKDRCILNALCDTKIA